MARPRAFNARLRERVARRATEEREARARARRRYRFVERGRADGRPARAVGEAQRAALEALLEDQHLFVPWGFEEILEDGGRFYKKRNIAIMIETNNANKIKLPSQDFLWLSLFQIRKLMKDKIIINPHIKSILSLI